MSDHAAVRALHWKTTFLTRWAAGRSIVWIDDETTDIDRHWVGNHHPGNALVHRVDPLVGLTDADFATIQRWLADEQRTSLHVSSERL